MARTYTLDLHGIYRPFPPIKFIDYEYDPTGFETLWRMQEKHFWYRGRYRFLLRALDRFMPQAQTQLRGIDLGGGVGGWVRYLADRRSDCFQRLVTADFSETALSMAENILPAGVDRYQIDLMNLGWENEWDIAFMLDVIEHLADDVRAVSQAAESLKPGGLLFVTTPAFPGFWSYNDDFANHLRRYTRTDFKTISEKTGLQLLDSRYFMFLLSPLYLLTRLGPGIARLSPKEKQALSEQQHRVPGKLLNETLTAIFAAETPIGHFVRFPWGTSVLGVFKKP